MELYPAGERFGNYEVTGAIGSGGMGAVYRAVHPEIGKVVAIKVMRPELARDTAAVARFFDEARAVNSIRHAGLVDIFDLGRRPDGVVFLVMEHLVGEDLGHLLAREGRLSPLRASAIVREVCASVGAAHRRGIIHRDLKPANLFVVTRAGEEHVKVLDFGTAKLLNRATTDHHTTAGVVVGTVQYMSPEQARGDAIDEQSDVYSLGCILYELVTGTRPFIARNAMEALAKLATEEAEPPSRRAPEAGIGKAVDALVLRAIAKKASERYADTEELAAALAALDDAELSASSPRAHEVAERVDGIAPTERAPVTPVPANPAMSTPLPSPPSPILPAHGESRSQDKPVSGPPAKAPSVSAPHAIAARESISGDAPATSKLTLAPPPLPDPARLLSSGSGTPPLIDAESERKVVRFLIPIILGMLGAAVGLFYTPGGVIDRELLGRYLPWFGLDIVAIAGLMIAVLKTQQRSRARWFVNRGISGLGVLSITVAIHFTGSLTSYDLLYYPLFVIIDRLREDRSLARLTMFGSMVSYTIMVIAERTGALDYAPLYPGQISPRLVMDNGLVALVLVVVMGATFISYVLVEFLGRRVQRREEELRDLGRGLAGRVEEQLELLKRSEDLRRYVSPHLAEAIMRGETSGTPRHERRRITMVRVDCPAIARTAEVIEPEEFAHLLNELLGRVADLAVAHGGTVDRFTGVETSVLFGAPRSTGPANDALAALAFARAAVGAVGELSRRCEAAGIEERPFGRAAVHTGFATVGSFGSPTRLEYTAVGPMAEAASALLARTEDDQVFTTHATWVLLRDQITAEPFGESTLPGARHPVKYYRVVSLTPPANAESPSG